MVRGVSVLGQPMVMTLSEFHDICGFGQGESDSRDERLLQPSGMVLTIPGMTSTSRAALDIGAAQ
jgi:hypothetical protein